MSGEQQVSELVLRWEKLRAQGQEVAAEELCHDTPELLAEFRRRVQALGAMDQVLNVASAVTDVGDGHATISTDPPARSLDFLAPAQQPDEIGRLGPYRVLKLLGEGGMGMVFQAEDPQLQRPVALKVMRPGMAATPSTRQRFLREARAAAALEDEHIVPIYHVGEDRGVPYLAMQLLKGESLEARLRREGHLPPAEVLRIGQEIACGLTVAHERGVIHRDIKPSNLWLHERPGGPGEAPRVQAKLLDFGLARSMSAEEPLTQLGDILGTPAYMSPEQAEGWPVDARSDLFSLGCVLYYMATGKPPFQGRSLPAMARAITDYHPPPPCELRPGMPLGLSDLIMRLLNKDPQTRPASAREVAEELRRLEAAGPATQPGTARSVASSLWPRRVRVPLLVTTGTAIVLAGLVLWRPWTIAPAPIVAPIENVRVRQLHVFLMKETATELQRYELGNDIHTARFGDFVQVKAEFSEPVYCFLLAFNPDGKEQLCWPADSHEAPERQDRLTYPPQADSFFPLTDGVGLQAFVLLASRQPLPAYDDWKAQRPELAWQTLPAKAPMVWRGDGKRLEPVMRGSEQRGPVMKLENVDLLAKLCRQLRDAPGVEVLAVEAFPVLSKDSGK